MQQAAQESRKTTDYDPHDFSFPILLICKKDVAADRLRRKASKRAQKTNADHDKRSAENKPPEAGRKQHGQQDNGPERNGYDPERTEPSCSSAHLCAPLPKAKALGT